MKYYTLLLFIFVLLVLNLRLHSQTEEIIYEPLISAETISSETVLTEQAINENLVVGKTPSSHQVTPSGAFTYQVPIRIPNGTKGMEPKISLVYSSQGGNGVLGFGWGISGLSAISRVNKTHFHEGKVENVQLDFDDPYSWDGNRLIPLNGASNGSNGTVYGTESESFAKITSHGQFGNGPLWFEVETKEGLIIEYGKNVDARIYSHDNLHIIGWKINRSIDRNGNYIDYTYINNGSEHLIDEIKYTGNINKPLLPYNSIKFEYKERDDQQKIYGNEKGKEIESNSLLFGIEIYSGTDLYKQYMFKYGFNYYSYLNEIVEFDKNGMEQFIPLKFSYFNAGHDFEEIPTNVLSGSFDYYPGDFNGDGVDDLLRASYWIGVQSGNVSYTGYDILFNDNGIFVPSYNLGFATGVRLQQGLNSTIRHDHGLLYFNIGDFNGDGKMDVTVVSAHYQTGDHIVTDALDIHYSTSTGNLATFTTTNYALPGNRKVGERNAVIQGDFNGDGAEDLYFNFHDGHKKDYGVHIDNWYNPVIYAPLVNVNPFIVTNRSQFDNNKLSYKDKVYPIDMNGNGKTDLMQVFEHSAVNVTKAFEFDFDVTALTASAVYNYIDDQGTVQYLNLPSKGHSIRWGDFNGDGKSDMIISSDIDMANWKLYFSKGQSFEFISNHVLNATSNGHRHLQVADLNGDGKSDLILTDGNFSLSNTTIHVYYSLGKTPTSVHDFKSKTETFSTFLSNIRPAYLLDSDGDGSTEIMTSTSIFDDLFIADFSFDNKFGQLAHISTGFKELTRVNYASISAHSDDCVVYTPVSNSTYPLVDFHKPIFVTSSVNIPDGSGMNSGGTFRKNYIYLYKGAKLHKQGKGFLGFERIDVVEDYQLGNENPPTTYSRTEYEIDLDYYFPRPIKSFSSIAVSQGCENGYIFLNNLVSTEYDYTTYDLADDRFINRLNSTKSGNNLIGYTSEVFYEYNHANSTETGNPSRIINITGDVATAIETTVIDLEYDQFGTHIPAHVVEKTTTTTRNGLLPFVNTLYYDFDPLNGNLLESGKKNSIGTVIYSMTFDYTGDFFGNAISETENVPGHAFPVRESTFEYDATGRDLTKRTNPEGYVEAWQYDAVSGKVELYNDILQTNGNTTYEYDNFHRFKSSQDEYGNITSITMEYEPYIGFSASESDVHLYSISTQTAGFGNEKVWYDHLGNARKTRNDGFNGYVYTVNNYLSRGMLQESTVPFYQTNVNGINQFIYDEYGRKFKSFFVDQAQNISSITEYNLQAHTGISSAYNYINRNVENTITSGPSSIKVTTDPTGKKISSQQNGGPTVEFKYYSSGNLKETEVDNVVVNSMDYDENGFQTSLAESNSGVTEYEYNVLGELLRQEDEKGNVLDGMGYDKLGRLIAKSINGNPAFQYNYINSGNGIGQLGSSISYLNNYSYTYSYNTDGDLSQLSELIDGKTFETNYSYLNGRLIEEKYNKTNQVLETKLSYTYGSHGQLETAGNANSIGQGSDFFNGTHKNSKGQWIAYELINGLTSSMSYDNTGFPVSLSSNVYNRTYEFDIDRGNLMERTDPMNPIRTESFQYDSYDRLKHAQSPSSPPLLMEYGNNGNILEKSDVGDYTLYHPIRQHAVVEIENLTQQINITTQEIDYDEFHNPTSIREGDFEWQFEYGPNHQRKMARIINTVTNVEKKRYYTATSEYQYFGNTLEYQVDYVSGGDGLCAMVVFDGSTSKTYAVYKDHLGSIELLTDDQANIVAEQSFDSWGRHRDPSNWNALNYIPALPAWLWRGYTGHEHLNEFQLINMNGRLYDPIAARMLSPDNVVQAPNNPQNYNRYSYVLNNPLKYTDPEGEWVHFVIGAVVGGVQGYMIGNQAGLKGWDLVAASIAGAGVGTLTAGVGSSVAASAGVVAGSLAGGAVGGAGMGLTTGLATGQNFSGVITSTLTGAFMGAATGLVGGAVGGAIGGGAGAFFGGASAGAFGSLLKGEDMLMGAILGGTLGYGLHHASNFSSYKAANIKAETGMTYSEWNRVVAISQRSMFWKREAKLIGNNRGGVNVSKLGKKSSISAKSSDYNDAKFDYHTHTLWGSETMDGDGFSTYASGGEASDEFARSLLNMKAGFKGPMYLGTRDGNFHYMNSNFQRGTINYNFSQQFLPFNTSWSFSISR